MGYDPAEKLTLVVWTNLKASPRGLACAQTIAERLIGAFTTESRSLTEAGSGLRGRYFSAR